MITSVSGSVGHHDSLVRVYAEMALSAPPSVSRVRPCFKVHQDSPCRPLAMCKASTITWTLLCVQAQLMLWQNDARSSLP